MSTPEWLRPVSERFLGDDPGPAPWTVRVAAVWSVPVAAVSAGMAVTFAQVAAEFLGRPEVQRLNVLLAGGLALTGAVLFGMFGAAPLMLFQRGWCRVLVRGGLVLASLALLGLFIFAGPAPQLRSTGETDPQMVAARSTTGWLLVTAVLGLGLAGLLRTGSASSWLASRRYQTRRLARGSGSERGGSAEQAGG